jgi:DNA-binding CsgD family transcriptional regulator
MMIRAMSTPRSDIASEMRRRTTLTGAEIRIAMAIYEGKSVSEVAEIAGISAGTARQQLKSVFRKTGTGRQAALIAWMRNLPDSPQQ